MTEPRTVRDLMRTPVTTVERHAHLAAAAYLMMRAGETALVVTTDDEAHRPIGIITDTDISIAVARGSDVNEARIDELIGPGPVTAPPGTTPAEAAEIMLAAHIRHLPVVEDGRLVGIIDITDACRALLDADQGAP